MREACKAQIERETRNVVGAVSKCCKRDTETERETILMQRHPGPGTETAREVKWRKAGITCNRGERRPRADIGCETLADRFDTRGVARAGRDRFGTADHSQDLDRMLVARKPVAGSQNGMGAAMKRAVRSRIERPRATGLACVS